MTKFFEKVRTLDELRKEYHRLAFLHHPDKGGNTKTMQAINNQYEVLTKKLINSHEDYSDERKDWEMHVSEELQRMIEKVIHLDGVTIELIGTWLWISGNTYAVKEKLKAIGCKYSPPKSAWYWHEGEYVKNNNSLHSMDELRNLWGHQEIESKATLQPSLN
jgi:curved DNA-binding protein CbpA